MRYNIGLDIGIGSVGFAVMELDEHDEPIKILHAGSRIFDVAEVPKTGEPLAKGRREARGMRRRLRRRALRKQRIRGLITSSGLVTSSQLETLYDGEAMDVYALRTAALDRILTNEELAKVLIHLSQRRGFRSNRKSGASKEDGVLLKAVSANASLMLEKGYRSVGEMLHKDETYSEEKRNKGESYKNTVSRDMVEAEAKAIFSSQREKSNALCSEEFEEKFLKILLSQRSFDEGPSGVSKYKVDFDKMVGYCTHFPEEKRAPKAAYSFEYSDLLQKINHLRIEVGGKATPLEDYQKKMLIELAHTSEGLNFAKIRKELGMEGGKFNLVRYENGKGDDAVEKSTKLGCLKSYHEMRKALDKVEKNRISTWTNERRNSVARVFSLYKNEDRLRSEVQAIGIDECDIQALLDAGINFSRFSNLSIKALDMLVPHLEDGMTYDKACDAAGINFKGDDKGHEQFTLSLQKLARAADNTITSPVAKRAISQTGKVVNAIIRQMGTSPIFINIELARDMSQTRDNRNKAEKDMKENQARNERIRNELIDTDGQTAPRGLDIVKLRLWQEQDGRCMYSAAAIPREDLFKTGVADIDHIVPYSISFNDTYNNKVLVTAVENRNKGARLPLQYLTGQKREDFKVRVGATTAIRKAKKNFLLKEEITDDDINTFKQRNLQDTRTTSAFVYRYLSKHLAFSDFNTNKKRHVTAVNGAVTAMLRSRWGLSKVREDGDLHHAIDACVVACTTQGDINELTMINKLSSYYRRRETKYTPSEDKELVIGTATGEVSERFPEPFEGFRDRLFGKINEVGKTAIDVNGEVTHGTIVSRMPRRKVTGEAHKETIKGISSDGKLLKKVALTDLKLNKDGEIDGFYGGNDPGLEQALKERLIEFDGDAKKAFDQPFFKVAKDGLTKTRVKKVKIEEKSTLNVDVHDGKGKADNSSIVRTDVFYVDGKGGGYYLVPIYVADTLKNTLPNKAIVAAKSYEDWAEMKDGDFLFSLYSNDLIYIKGKKPMEFSRAHDKGSLPNKSPLTDEMYDGGHFVYYKGCDIALGQISFINHDNSYKNKIGVKTLVTLEKWEVDVLGNKSLIGFEPRQTFGKKAGE